MGGLNKGLMQLSTNAKVVCGSEDAERHKWRLNCPSRAGSGVVGAQPSGATIYNYRVIVTLNTNGVKKVILRSTEQAGTESPAIS